MAKIVVTGTLVTTRPIDKYGGIQVPLETLERLRDQIGDRHVPMQMNHSVLNALNATILDVRIENVSEEEHALLVDFEVEEGDWAAVEAEWSAAGVPGGFSAALTQVQERLAGPEVLPVTLVSDAGAYSDLEREEAGRRISDVAPVEVLRLFQFSEPDFAKIVLEFGREVAAAGLVASIGYLVGRHKGRSHVELRRTEVDSSVTTAVIETDDPEIVRAAAESFDAISAPVGSEILTFDNEKQAWETTKGTLGSAAPQDDPEGLQLARGDDDAESIGSAS